MRFTPASPLLASANFVVTLTSELKDVSGNALTNPGTISFTSGVDSDSTAPTVTASTPYYNQTEVGRRPLIRVAFSEMINPITVTSTSFYLYNYYTGTVVRSTIAIAPDRLSATLVPDTVLEPHSYYYYYLSPFADIAGNSTGLGATYFRTSGVEDTQPPALLSIAPANGATNVPVNARIRVAVSEPIDASSIALQLVPAVAGTIVADADRLGFLFTPATNLAVSTSYALQIGPLRDSSGNAMATVVSSFTTSASPTPDTIAPTVVSISPATGTTNVSVTSPIVLTASEPLRASGLVGAMRVFANIPLYGSVQLAGTYTVNATGTVITFTPLVPYPGGTAITRLLELQLDDDGPGRQHAPVCDGDIHDGTGRRHHATDGRHGDTAGWDDGHRTGRDRDADVLGTASSGNGQQRHVHAVCRRRGDQPIGDEIGRQHDGVSGRDSSLRLADHGRRNERRDGSVRKRVGRLLEHLQHGIHGRSDPAADPHAAADRSRYPGRHRHHALRQQTAERVNRRGVALRGAERRPRGGCGDGHRWRHGGPFQPRDGVRALAPLSRSS